MNVMRTITGDDPVTTPQLPQAACLSHSDLFASELLDLPADVLAATPTERRAAAMTRRDTAVEQALTICGTCPHLTSCREYATNVAVFGVAGGLAPEHPDRARRAGQSAPSPTRTVRPSAPVDPQVALALLDDGLTSSQIADQLGCSERTIRRIAARRAVAQTPVPDVATVPMLHTLPVSDTAEAAFYRPYPPDADRSVDYPATPAVGWATAPMDLPVGAAIDQPRTLAPATAAIMDALLSGEPVAREDLLSTGAAFTHPYTSLTVWASTASQPTVVDGVRVLPPGMSRIPADQRESRGARMAVTERLQAAIDNRWIVDAGYGYLQISRQAWAVWAPFRWPDSDSVTEQVTHINNGWGAPLLLSA